MTNKEKQILDWVQTLGGLLLLLYFPLMIGLLWLDTETMIKLIITNTILVILIWIIDKTIQKE